MIRDQVLAFFICAKPRRAGAGIAVRARGYKVQGLQTVDLSWTAASSSGIDIYRNGVLIVTVPNNNFYTDHPDGRSDAIYTYKVSGAGTGNCSNQGCEFLRFQDPLLNGNSHSRSKL